MNPRTAFVLLFLVIAAAAACDRLSPEERSIVEITCQDGPYSTGYMVRLPQEPHENERCMQIATRAAPREVPEVAPFLHNPLRPTKESR